MSVLDTRPYLLTDEACEMCVGRGFVWVKQDGEPDENACGAVCGGCDNGVITKKIYLNPTQLQKLNAD